jgi:hypothetical protein
VNTEPCQSAQHYCTRILPTACALGVALLCFCLLAACKTAAPGTAADTARKPAVVYVTDFQLWAEDIVHEEGMVSGRLAERPGVLGRVGTRLSGAPEDPSERARQLVELMSTSLVKDLGKAGLKAVRVQQGTPLPSEGWLVQGCYAKVDEGHRLQRSMVGFGQGQTDVQVVASYHDLSKGPAKSMDEVVAEARSGRKPGGAATLFLSPWGAAAHFVMARHDLEKNVKQTASEIAQQVAQRIQQRE